MRVPYFSQFESPQIVLDYIAGDGEAVLRRDPLWARSGARDLDEYARWAGHVCGMACLKMILADLTGEIHPTLALARQCTGFGGYVEQEDGTIRGLIYAPFARFVSERFGLEAEVITGVAAPDVPALMQRHAYMLASVHPAIRWPEREPPARGGHLVLVTRADEGAITFHNPSGHKPETQRDATLPVADFDRFFAGRGVGISPRG